MTKELVVAPSLDLAGGGMNAKTVSEALSETLETTCLKATDANEAARKITASPKLLAEAQNALPVVSRLSQGISKVDLYEAIQPLVVIFGEPDFGQDQTGADLQKMWFDILYKAMADMPREAVDIAVSECIRTRKYKGFPQPAELVQLGQEAAAEIRLIAFRIKHAVHRSQQHKPRPKRTEDDIATVKAMIEQMRGPDGRIHLGAAPAVEKPKDRSAVAATLRRLADYR